MTSDIPAVDAPESRTADKPTQKPIPAAEAEKAAVAEMAKIRGNTARHRAYMKYFEDPKSLIAREHYLELDRRADHIFCVSQNRHCRPGCGCPNSFDPESPRSCECDYCIDRMAVEREHGILPELGIFPDRSR